MRYWIGVASKNHVMRGVEGGFCQLCHGKAAPLKRMGVGDWIIYYSPTLEREGNAPCQQFTAIGRIVDDAVYSFEMFPGFVPYRRNVAFVAASDVSIRPLIESLSFIKDKSRWGYVFRFGHVEIGLDDFEQIASRMLGRKFDERLSVSGSQLVLM